MQHAFVYIRQLALHLRRCMITTAARALHHSLSLVRQCHHDEEQGVVGENLQLAVCELFKGLLQACAARCAHCCVLARRCGQRSFPHIRPTTSSKPSCTRLCKSVETFFVLLFISHRICPAGDRWRRPICANRPLFPAAAALRGSAAPGSRD